MSAPPRRDCGSTATGAATNANLATAINKDWPGRPCYQDSYIASYFATRQWVRAVQAWVNNDAFWNSAMNANAASWGVPDDWKGAHEISSYSGLWTGGGQPKGAEHPGPGGSLDDLIVAISAYHLGAGKTTFRNRYEKIVVPMASTNPPVVGTLFMPSQDMQKNTEFVAVSINHLNDATTALQFGVDPLADEADFYARARIAGQNFTSGMIHGRDTVKFLPPLYPFTFIKAVPKGVSVDEPLVNLEVNIETADDLHAGTDDDIYVAINNKNWFNLDLPLYNDFERGNKDTYSIVVPNGLLVKDIDFIRLGKKEDGVAGGWKLGGISVRANGAVVYEKHGIDTWLEKSNLVWQAPDFVKKTPKTTDIPITISLYDSDGFLYGKDDHCDINLCYGQYDLHVLYNPNTGAFRGDFAGKDGAKTTGGSIFGGEGQDDDRCEMTFGLKRVAVTPAAKLPPPERNEPDSPDLVRVRAPEAPDQPKIAVLNPVLIPAVVGTRIEAEDAEIVTAWQPPPVKQDMTPFGKEWSNNAQLWYPATESGDRFAIFLNVSTAGSYAFSACFTKGPDYGGVRAALDGSWIGESIDCYAPKVSVTGEVSLGVVQLTEGKHDIAFLVQGKSRQSSGYMAGVDYIVMKSAPSTKMLETGTLITANPVLVEAAVGTGAFQIEGEDAAISGSQGGTTEKQDMSRFGSQWSKNAHLWFRPQRPGAYFTLKINVPQTRSYNISAYLTKAPDYGIVQVALDGKPLGQPFDGYATAVTRSEAVSLGSVELSTGEHQMSFEVVGKNANSVHYLVGLDLVVFK